MGARGAGRPPPATAYPARATFLELFFDLVFVFALTRISARAFEDLALDPGGTEGWAAITGGAKTLLLLLALWSVWQSTAWTTSRYDPQSDSLQLIVIIALVCSMVMGVAIPRAFSETGLAFATAYVVTQLSRSVILLLALGPHPFRRLKVRMTIAFTGSGALWIGGALLPDTLRALCWLAALAIEYVSARLGYPVPGLGRSAVSKWEIAGEHLAERYQQFFLVALGETILVAGFSYSPGPYGAGQTTAFALALGTTILLWRIYVQRAGQILAEAVSRARNPATIGRSAADSHLVMIAGLVVTAIGYELAIRHPLDQPEPAWQVMILGGPALFLAGRARFEFEVFARVSPSRWVAILALLVAIPLVSPTTPLVCAALAGAILTGVAVADTRRAWGRPPEAAVPPY